MKPPSIWSEYTRTPHVHKTTTQRQINANSSTHLFFNPRGAAEKLPPPPAQLLAAAGEEDPTEIKREQELPEGDTQQLKSGCWEHSSGEQSIHLHQAVWLRILHQVAAPDATAFPCPHKPPPCIYLPSSSLLHLLLFATTTHFPSAGAGAGAVAIPLSLSLFPTP